MHRLRVAVAVLERVIFQRKSQLVPHEAHIPLDGFGRSSISFARVEQLGVGIFARANDLVDIQHLPHGQTTGS